MCTDASDCWVRPRCATTSCIGKGQNVRLTKRELQGQDVVKWDSLVFTDCSTVFVHLRTRVPVPWGHSLP